MKEITVEYLKIGSKTYGSYALLRLKELSPKELRSNLSLLGALLDNFGDRFAVVQQSREGTDEFVLSEELVGIPTPEFERRLKEGVWKTTTIELKNGDS